MMAADIYRVIMYICLAGAFILSPVLAEDETPTPTPTQTFTPANIDFTANVTSGYVPLHVLFTDITEYPGEIYSREWYFGDGSWFQDSTPEVAHTYTDPGLYTVTFNRQDEQGTHVKIRYNYISVMIPPTPTTTVTTAPTTTQTTAATTTVTTTPTTYPSPTTTSSQPPVEFWGVVTELGNPAPAGSLIIAKIDDQERGRITTVVSGAYGGSGAFDERLKVTGTSGDIVTFWLNNRQADQTAIYSSGSQTLDLTFTTSPTTMPTTDPTTTVPTTIPVTTVPTTTVPTTIPVTTVPPTTVPTTIPVTTVPTTTAPTTIPVTTVPTTTPTTVPTTIPTPIPDMYLPLYKGWNFISVPLVLDKDHDTGDIFSMIDTGGRVTWTYNASLSRWQKISSDTPLEQMEGIWIYSVKYEQFGLYFSKHQGMVNRSFYEGWNALGIPGSYDRSARDALAPVRESWVYGIGFNGASQEYDTTIIKGGTGEMSDLRHMFPAKGYWVFFRENATFEASPTHYL